MYNLSKFEMIKQQLTDLQTETQGKQVPELIEKTNVLRENELLKKLIEKQSLLVEFYKSYIEILEELLSKFNTSKPKTRKATKTKKIQKTRSTKKKIVKRKPIKRKNSSKRKTKKKRKSR